MGDGPLRDSLQELSKKMHIETFGRICGHREDIHDVINLMDMAVLCSLHGGVPTSGLEALAMGKAAVGTKVCAIAEVLRQDALSILVEPEEPRSDP